MALDAAASVRVDEVAELEGEKLAVKPVGRPEAAKLTAELKPLAGLTVIASVPLDPCGTVRLVDAGARVKVAPAVMTSDTVAVALVEPDVPVIVNGYVPVGVVRGGYTISRFPENAVPTPEGAPETARLTLPLKPLTGVTVIVSVPPAFCCRVSGLAAAARVKPGVLAAAMTRFTVMLLEKELELPEPGAVAVMTME